MTNLSIKELAHLNRLVKMQKARFQGDSAVKSYANRTIAECPAYVQRSRMRIAELSDLSAKLEQMILETPY